MLCYKTFRICLFSLSASTILFSSAAFGQTVNQQVNGSAVGPETFVEGTNFTVNPTGTLNQTVNCEARNDVPNIDPSCKGHNTAIYGGKPSHGGGNNHHDGHHNPSHNHPHSPNLNQTVTNGGTNTTVITPTRSNSNSYSSSHSDANSSSNSNSKATVSDSGNSNNNNSNTNVSQGGNAKVGNINNSSNSQVGDQKNQQSVTTGSTNVSPNVSPNISPSTRIKVDGDQYNSIQFGNQAPGTGGEAFSFNYRSACGASVSYRQGFALKPRRIGGGGFGFALDVSSTDMDTIENRSGVQGKMDTAFLTAMNVVDNQQNFEQRLNTGAVSRQEAETRAVANCAPSQQVVRNVSNEKTVEVRREYVDKRRTCTSQGCN